MALVVNSIVASGVGEKVLSLAADSSYPTDGYPIDLEAVSDFTNGIAIALLSNAAGRNAVYDRANKKLLLYAGTTQVVNATDLSALTDMRLLVKKAK